MKATRGSSMLVMAVAELTSLLYDQFGTQF